MSLDDLIVEYIKVSGRYLIRLKGDNSIIFHSNKVREIEEFLQKFDLTKREIIPARDFLGKRK